MRVQVFQATRPARFPAPKRTSVTVTAVIDQGVVSIGWKRDDLGSGDAEGTRIALTLEEFRAIAAAVEAGVSR